MLRESKMLTTHLLLDRSFHSFEIMVDEKKSRIPAILLFLTAIAGPTAAGVGIHKGLFERPWKAYAWSTVYGLAVLGFGFVSRIWDKLQSRWVDAIADWIDQQIRFLFSNYEDRYLRHVTFANRHFDVKGLATQGAYALEMDHVFVELGVVPGSPNQSSADPIERPIKSGMTPSRNIWEYLRENKESRWNLAILGSPGSGKTTLLKHVALRLAATRRNRPIKAIPVLLFLRDHSDGIRSNPDLSLSQIIREALGRMECPPPLGWLEKKLRLGKCVIMLDGLDEVGDPDTRKVVVQWVDRQILANSLNRFLVTSRPFGYRDNPLSAVTVLQVRPFSGHQVKTFIHNWYLANEIMSAQKDDEGVRLTARNGAEDLLRRLRNMPALSELAVNPLLLTMITTVHRYRSSLPGRRVELYAEICDVFLGKRQQAKGLILDLTPAQKKHVLTHLAFRMMQAKERAISLQEAIVAISEPLQKVGPQNTGEDFLRLIENSSGLLLEREAGTYSFAHLTIQEYLAAVYIATNRVEKVLIEQIGTSWWHETIRLYAAQADATSIISACLIGARPSVPLLTLAIECLDEAREVEPNIREEIRAILARGVDDPDPARRHAIGEALLTLRVRKMVRIDEESYVDDTFISNAEYQLFLDESYLSHRFLRPDHWEGDRFRPGSGTQPVVGIRGSDAVEFCEWLTKRDPDGWIYQLIAETDIDTEPAVRTRVPSPVFSWCLSSGGPLCPLVPESQKPILLEFIRKKTDQVIKTPISSSEDIDDELDRSVTEAVYLSQNITRTLTRPEADQLSRSLDLSVARARVVVGGDIRDFSTAFETATGKAIDILNGALRSLDVNQGITRATGMWKGIDRAPFGNRAKDHAHTRCLDYACVLFEIALSRRVETTGHTRALLNSLSEAFFVLAALFVYAGLLERTRTDKRRELYVNNCLTLFVDSLSMLERVEGRLIAWEGIRITKSRIDRAKQ